MGFADSRIQAEYDSLTSERGYVPLVGWSSISITGADRVAFLHNFCTNDVKRLRPGDACEAFLTDVKGKIVGHVLVTCREDELVLVSVPNQAEDIIEHLDRYLIREDVTLQNTSGERNFGLLTGMTPDGVPFQSCPLCFVCGWLAPITSVLVEGKIADDSLTQHDVLLCGTESFHSVRIEAGFPLYAIDFDRANLPQEIGRDVQAISFTKGCYLGQETVARIDALGHVNRQLVGVRFATPNVPQPPIELRRDDAVVGRVTSTTCSPQLDAPLGLAVVRREVCQPGTKLTSEAGDCEVVTMPVRGEEVRK